MGDAAHAATPWQASGGGMSVEDSFILSSLLSRARTTSEAVNALKGYDERWRHQDVSGPVKEKLEHRWVSIFDIDLEKHRDEAVAMMDRLNR
ncbi:hypothetical protein diail_10724 [Diaporthe ilicicola]|nr:hypothetical protein diail_10724 [Diaporthe ilicicola]